MQTYINIYKAHRNDLPFAGEEIFYAKQSAVEDVTDYTRRGFYYVQTIEMDEARNAKIIDLSKDAAMDACQDQFPDTLTCSCSHHKVMPAEPSVGVLADYLETR